MKTVVPPKAPTGITGFDEITGGGLPRGRTTLLAGGPGSGSGKTILALQFLVHGAQDCKQPGILALLPDAASKRREIYRLHEWLLAHELAGVITAKADGDENEFPFLIGKNGHEVAVVRTRGRAESMVIKERVSSGVVRRDTMLSGGYYRGASVLITGVPAPCWGRRRLCRLRQRKRPMLTR